MINRKELKKLSKEQLRGQWTTVVLITLGFGVANFILTKLISTLESQGSSTFTLSFLSMLLIITVAIFSTNLYLKLTRGVKVKASDMFVSGRTFIRSLGVMVLEWLMVTPAIILVIIVGSIISVAVIDWFGLTDKMMFPSDIQYLFLSHSWTYVLKLFLVFAILGIIISIPIIILSYYLYPAKILMCEDDSRGIGECISTSFRLMSGHIWSYFILQLSFVGWSLLCILTLGIGTLWLMPYIKTTNMNFFNKIVGYENGSINPISYI